MASDYQPSSWRTVCAGVRLLSGRERRIAIAIAIAVAVVEVMQIAGMLLVVPVVSMLVDESTFTTSRYIVMLAAWIGNPPFETFLHLLAGAALLLIVTAHLATFAVQSATEIFVARFQTRLFGDVLAECARAPYIWFLDRNSAALVRLFHNDFAIWAREFVGNILVIFSNAVAICGGSALIVAVAPWYGLLAIIGVGVVAWGAIRLVHQGLNYWTRQKRREAERSSIALMELLAGIKDVITSGAWRHFVRICAMRFGSMSRASARTVIYGSLPAAVLILLAQTSLLLILLLLWHGGVRGGALAAQMTLVLLVVSRVIPAMSRLAGVSTRIANTLPWVAGIVELRESIARAQLGSAVSGKAEVPARWRLLKFDDVSFAYTAGGNKALDGLTIELHSRGCYGLIGGSGSGKTTFVDLLLGLLDPTGGCILVDDVPLTQIDVNAWRKRIGYVSQSPYFVDDSVRVNVVFGDLVNEEWLEKCIQMAGLKEFVAALPEGLDAKLGDRALAVSGGQKQRIAIARALYRRPDILVMDEATSALDTTTEKFIVQTLADLKSAMTIIIVSHRMSALTNCDRILTLADGHMGNSATASERGCNMAAV